MYTRINLDGKCAEFTWNEPTGKYHESMLWLSVPVEYQEYVDANYISANDSVAPPESAYLANQIKEKIATHRWAVQNAGVMVATVPVRTTDYDYSMLRGAINALENGDIPDTPWKSDSGWQQVTPDDLPTLKAFRKATAEHIRAVFMREKELSDQIDALIEAALDNVVEQLLAIDWKEGWPPTIDTLSAS